MWTYFAIFLSIGALVTVFSRRLYLVLRKKKSPEAEVKTETVKEQKEEKTKISIDDKQSLEALFKRAEAMINTGNEEEAIKCFVQVLAIDDAHKKTKNKLAMLYMHKKKFGSAAALFRQLAEAEEDSVHYSHLGLALFNQKDFEEAKKAYQKAVEIDPSRPQRFVSLCQVYRAINEPTHAVIALNKALKIDEDNVDYLFLLADLQLLLEDPRKSISTLKKLLKLDPDNTEALSLLREAKEELK